MNSSRVVIFIAAILIFIVVFLKFSENKLAKVQLAQSPTQNSQAPQMAQPAAPPQAATHSPTYNQQQEEQQDSGEERGVYVSEYKGKSQSFMVMKRKVATYALREYLSDKGMRIDPPITFFDFNLYEEDLNTSVFDTSPNELQQEMLIAIRRTTDAKGFLTDLVTERGLSLGGSTAPRPLDGKGNFFLLSKPEMNVVYYVGPAKSGHSAIVALIQKNPIPTSLIEAFRNSIAVGGN